MDCLLKGEVAFNGRAFCQRHQRYQQSTKSCEAKTSPWRHFCHARVDNQQVKEIERPFMWGISRLLYGTCFNFMFRVDENVVSVATRCELLAPRARQEPYIRLVGLITCR